MRAGRKEFQACAEGGIALNTETMQEPTRKPDVWGTHFIYPFGFRATRPPNLCLPILFPGDRTHPLKITDA